MLFKKFRNKIKYYFIGLVVIFSILFFSGLFVIDTSHMIIIIVVLLFGFLLYKLHKSKTKNGEKEKNEAIEKENKLKEVIQKLKSTSHIVGMVSDIKELALQEFPLEVSVPITEYYNENGERVFINKEIENSLSDFKNYKKIVGTITLCTKVKVGFDLNDIKKYEDENNKLIITGATPQVLSGLEAFDVKENIVVLESKKNPVAFGLGGETLWSVTKETFKFKNERVPEIIQQEKENLRNSESPQILALKSNVKYSFETFIKGAYGDNYNNIIFDETSAFLTTSTPLIENKD